jgi:DNA-binding transcriptional LysR family regulator
MRVELRDIEIFLVLAEELHFGRTAERLHVSRARVSQAIKKQERRIGAPLFDRTSRTVTLTPIGQRLRDDLQQAYDLVQSGLARATAAALGVHGTLRLGAMGVSGNEMQPVISTFRARHADSDVEITEFHFSDPFARLRSGEVDLQLMWLPVREPDMTVGRCRRSASSPGRSPVASPIRGIRRSSLTSSPLPVEMSTGPRR